MTDAEIADKTRKMVRDPLPKGGRESVVRPTDRTIRARPGQHGWGGPGPSKSEFARATDKRAARLPTRSRKAAWQTNSDDNTSSPACGRCRPNVARSGHGSGGTFGNGSA